MKTKPHAEGFLVSGKQNFVPDQENDGENLSPGYPRNMHDTSEYLELDGKVDGVILLNWHLNTLERQIEYGAQLGEVDLAAAKVELINFKKQVIPVAEFFDTKQLLHLVTGDREPHLVFEDFKQVLQNILQTQLKVRSSSRHGTDKP